MRKYLVAIILLSVIFLSNNNLTAQGDFEGKVKFKITHDDEVSFLDYFIKGENLRMEMGDNAEAVFIKNGKRSLVLMTEDKMYMDLDNSLFNKFKDMAGMNENDDEEENEEEINIKDYKTGKTKTILGYSCDQWLFKDEEEDEEVEAWVTSELGNFMLMQSPMGAGYSPGWSSSVSNNGFFPILVINKDEDGEEVSRFEAVEIDKESLSDDLFSPPSDYSEMKMPGMGNFLR